MFYEMRPWMCLALGFVATVKNNHSLVALASGLTLLACGALVLKFRYDARSLAEKRIQKGR